MQRQGPTGGGARRLPTVSGGAGPLAGGVRLGGGIDRFPTAAGWGGAEDGEARFRFPGLGLGGIGAAAAGGAQREESNGELTAAIRELTAVVKRLADQMEKQSRMGAGKAADAGPKAAFENMRAAIGNPNAARDLLKQAVAGSGKQMEGRSDNMPVARAGPLVRGGAAQQAGFAPAPVRGSGEIAAGQHSGGG
jgi:hypothetical protein